MKLMSTHRDGFALPTILIASVVMLMVMVTAIQAAASISVGLNNQYYNKVAEEAAESGAAKAQNCLKANNYIAGWGTAKPLKPNTDCNGNVMSGWSSYVLDDASGMRTSFTVGSATTTSTAVTMTVNSTFDLLRTSNSSVWRTYSASLKVSVSQGVNAATDLSSGIYEVCGVFDGQTWCWGTNDQGQLGIGAPSGGNTLVPAKVSRAAGGLSGKTDKMVAVGNLRACIVTTDNLIYCMGDNSGATLGDGTNTDRAVPTPVVTTTGLAGKTITGIVEGSDFTCAIASGDIYCWGQATYGQLGGGNTTNKSVPTLVGTIGQSVGKPVTEIATTPQLYSACAIATVATVGKAYCWGHNERGQIGDGTYNTDRLVPTAVSTSGALLNKSVLHIATGGGFPYGATPYDDSTPDKTRRAHACVVTSDWGLYCWGSNQYGQMGQGSASLTRQLVPIQVTGGSLFGKLVSQVATSYADVCALNRDTPPILSCWGQNDNGSVGNNSTNDVYSPTPVVTTSGLAGKTITDINGGVNRNCVIASGVNYCWGYNSNGQLGDGTTITRLVPTEASVLRRFSPTILY